MPSSYRMSACRKSIHAHARASKPRDEGRVVGRSAIHEGVCGNAQRQRAGGCHAHPRPLQSLPGRSEGMPVLNRLRRRFYQVDRGLWLAVLLSLLAAWAFILRPSLPRETDAELHVFRAAELGYALRAGVLYPRWAADFYYGYGYPIFNYYAPLTYYLANLLSLALPGGAVFGVKAVFVLGFLSAGVGTYGLTRRLIDRRGALIATASYLFAPYIFLIDPHLRGVLAEFFALGLLPPVFWALTAFRQSPSRKHLVVASLLVTAFLLSHNLMALVGFGMLLAYTLWHALIVPLLIGSRPRPTDAIRQAFPLLIGLALAAFFWLPVIMERDAVQLGNLIGPGHFDYHNHFLSLRELFSPSVPLDLGAVNPAFRFNLGLAQWALALIGLVALALVTVHARRTGTRWAAQAEQTAGAAFWLLALIGLIGLMLPLSTPIWEAIPPMAFLQFPWRLLGTAALCAAVLAGYTAHLLDLAPRPAQPYTFAALFVLPLVLALPIFIPPTWNWHDFGPTDQLAMLEFELNGLALGTTSTGDYVPVEVEVVPDPNPDLIASYRRGGPIDKV
ncbi:MAG TPA: hypothetical protein ENI95_08900, partial [Chloroflexi bacterium]|nr:hypothetical protein [Chloroflexota bacterium]